MTLGPKPRSRKEYIPAKPFSDWLNQRYDELSENPVPNEPGASQALCIEIGWMSPNGDGYEGGVRRLRLYRRQRIASSRHERHTDWYARATVEDALHHAGVDFYEMYPEYAHEREVQLEPDVWCPTCAAMVTPLNGFCPWDETRLDRPEVLAA